MTTQNRDQSRGNRLKSIAANAVLMASLIGLTLTAGVTIAHGEGKTNQASDGRFEWRILTWNDFAVNNDAKGAIDQAAAQTETFIGYTYSARASKRSGTNRAVAAVTRIDWRGGFDPTLSWRRSFVTERNAQLLRHEQGHLDINEIVIRDLRSRPLSSYPQGYGTTLQEANDDLAAKLKTYYADRREELRRAQSLYDTQTVSGTSEKEQGRWSALLTDALNKPTNQLSARQ